MALMLPFSRGKIPPSSTAPIATHAKPTRMVFRCFRSSEDRRGSNRRKSLIFFTRRPVRPSPRPNRYERIPEVKSAGRSPLSFKDQSFVTAFDLNHGMAILDPRCDDVSPDFHRL